MRCPRPFVVAAFVALSACDQGYDPFYIRAHIPEKVTTDGLLSLKNGMTYAQVEQVVGPPLCIVEVDDKTLNDSDQKMAHRLVGNCSTTAQTVPKNLVNANTLVLSYAEPRAVDPIFDPSIYAHFQGGRFSHLYIKYHDYGICCMDGLPTSPFYWIGSRDLLHRLIGR